MVLSFNFQGGEMPVLIPPADALDYAGYSKLVRQKQLPKALLQLCLLAGHCLQKIRYKFVFD